MKTQPEYEIQSNGTKKVRKLLKSSELCTTTPILAYANFGKPFKLHTDASGAILYQEQDGVEKVISYAS